MTNHVKIEGIPPRIQYVADGQNAVFEFPFAIFKPNNLQVYCGNDLQSDTNYTIEMNTDITSGSVRFNSIPQNGTIITLLRNLQIERTTDFQEGGALRSKTLNDELDYQIACQQQIADNLNRSMVLPPYAVNIDVDLTLPIPEAGKAIVWNSDGTNLENSTVSVNALESTLNGYKQSAESASANATAKADEATIQAQTATTQASIATQKAEEATSLLANKADTDADNFTQIGKEKIVTFGIPDYSAGINISAYNSSSNQFTAPCAGEVRALVNVDGNNGVYVNNLIMTRGNANDSNARQQLVITVDKSDKIYITGGTTHSSGLSQTFYPLKGVNNA